MRAHLDALEEFNCLRRVVTPINNIRYEIATKISDDKKRTEVLQAPDVLSEAIDTSVIRYARKVLGQEAGNTSPGDQKRFYEQYADDLKNRETTETEGRKQMTRNWSDEAEATLAAVPFLGLRTSLEACQKGLTPTG